MDVASMDASKLKNLLQSNFPNAIIDIAGDNYHRLVTITSDEFQNLPRFAREQKVNKILFPFYQNGELHALTLKALTFGESNHV